MQLFVQQGQTVRGRVLMRANMRQSYDVEIEVTLPGLAHTSRNSIDLKNPLFRYTGQPVAAPPGAHTGSPSDAYWSGLQTGIVTVNAADNATGAVAIAQSQNMPFQMASQLQLANYTSGSNQQQQQQLFTNGLAMPVQVMNGVPVSLQYSAAQAHVVQPGAFNAHVPMYAQVPSEMAAAAGAGFAQFPVQMAAGGPELQVGAMQEVVTSPPAAMRVVSPNGQHVPLARAGRSSSAFAGGLRQPQPSASSTKQAMSMSMSPTAAGGAALVSSASQNK